MSRNGIDLPKIQTYVIKVHMHCQGCQQKVKKLLRKIEGTVTFFHSVLSSFCFSFSLMFYQYAVIIYQHNTCLFLFCFDLCSGVYSVNIDAEHHVVIVSGRVDSATLIRKLVRSGKHAELWPPKSHQKLNQGQPNFGRDEKGVINGLDAFKTRQIYPSSLGNDAQDHWSLDNYLNQNIRMKTTNDGIDHNQMAVAKVDDTYMRDYEDRLAMENQMRSMMAPPPFSGNGVNFVGLGDHNFGGFQECSTRRPVYEYEHPTSMPMNNMQTLYYFNPPSPQIMDVDNSMMGNPHYMSQPQMINYRSSLAPPYNDFGFSLSPFSYY
ncbi:hypothetical protein Pint_18645 [Pistacia integerrima]|uniref:Uncharacterized protein n=1 Tax=Pistacia integerrima TaxID=434235 RepID=A0ACC0YX13_9ROSI|nr:hypothetical protein Pint_18645 [Pistacia integerrima]